MENNLFCGEVTMAARVGSWTAIYDRIEVVDDPKRVAVPPVTKTELDAVESELGFKLPKSYRAFMMRFGPGSLVGYWLLPIIPKQTRPRETVTEITLTNRERIRKYGTECSSNPEWDLGMVVFGGYGPHSFIWNSADSASDGDERCVYDVCYEDEQPPNKIAESFWRFVEYIEVGSCHPRNPYKRGEGGLYFQPATLSEKRAPNRSRAANSAEPTDEADRGRHPGFARHEVLQAAPAAYRSA